jgi:serine/threonine protein phosphatase PrpC
MFLVDWLTGGNKFKKGKKGKKKKKVEDKTIDMSALNQLKTVKIVGASKQGYGPKKTECQDSYCIIEKITGTTECNFFAVYDGHGTSGKEASQAANDYIQTFLEKNAKKIKFLVTDKQRESFLKSAFKTAEGKLKNSGIDYSNSGTCSIGVFLIRTKCYITNLGDSRAVLYRVTPKERLAIELSYDHKPTRPDEKERILKSGGKVEKLIHDNQPVGPYRVWLDDEGPGIAMTRTLGDLQAKKIGLISEPEIESIELHPQTDKFIVIGSDGIWDVMSSAEVVGFVNQYINREVTPGEMPRDKDIRESAAEELVKEARSRWEDMNKSKKKNAGIGIGDLPYLKFGCDDITAVICFLQFYTEEELQELIKAPHNNVSR